MPLMFISLMDVNSHFGLGRAGSSTGDSKELPVEDLAFFRHIFTLSVMHNTSNRYKSSHTDKRKEYMTMEF